MAHEPPPPGFVVRIKGDGQLTAQRPQCRERKGSEHREEGARAHSSGAGAGGGVQERLEIHIHVAIASD